MTNIYTTEENRVELVTPLNMLRSVMSWEEDEEGNSYILIKDVPVMKWQETMDEEYEKEFDRFMNILSSQYDYMNEILYKKTNNYSVDMKFYNTYGRSNNFVYGEEQDILNRVNCTVHFKVYPTIRSEGAKLVQDMKMFIKEYFESINAETNEGIYISNLIQQLENTFSNIKYLKFESINGYDNDVQNIENLAIDVTTLSKEEKIEFVPEYLNIELEDIIIDLIN
jgi:hypothetical protein